MPREGQVDEKNHAVTVLRSIWLSACMYLHQSMSIKYDPATGIIGRTTPQLRSTMRVISIQIVDVDVKTSVSLSFWSCDARLLA